MTQYEIGELDLTAQVGAAQSATNYITADSSGIHIASANPTSATTYVQITNSSIGMCKDDIEYIKLWENNNIPTIRVGHSLYGHTDITSNGMEIFDGDDSIASFGEIIRIGKEYINNSNYNKNYMELDSNSIKLIDKNNICYFEVCDLRTDLYNGCAFIEESFIIGENASYDSSTSRVIINLEFVPNLIENPTVIVEGTDVSWGGLVTGYAKGIYAITSSAPQTGAKVSVSYLTIDPTAKAFTFGTRQNQSHKGAMSFSEGYSNTASGQYSHAEGFGTTASGNSSHAEGAETTASGNYSHAEGCNTRANRNYSHAEGYNTTANGTSSHAEGWNTIVNGSASHAEGWNTRVNGNYSHAEGQNTMANGNYSHAEGYYAKANGSYSHAEGNNTKANGSSSHAEGYYTIANGYYCHAEGCNTVANNFGSHSQNYHTIASSDYQTSLGKYNTEDLSDTYAVIIGNGTADDARSDALTIDWDGNIETKKISESDTSNDLTYHKIWNFNENKSLVGYSEIRNDSTNNRIYRSFVVQNPAVSGDNNRCGMYFYVKNDGTRTAELINGVAWPIKSGGTGATTAAAARTNLGLGDSGWKTLTLASGWAVYETAQTPKYRKIGSLVEVCGAVKPTATTTLNDTATVFGTLPTGYRPAVNKFVLCQASGVKSWLLGVYANGNVTAARLRAQNSTSYQTAATTEWLVFNIMYFVD